MDNSLLKYNGSLLTDIMKGKNVRKLSRKESFWLIKSGLIWRKDYDTRRKELLSAIIQGLPIVYLEYNENPIEDKLAGSWENAEPYVWIIPKDLSIDEVYDWLVLGDWVIYICRSGVCELNHNKYGTYKAKGYMQLLRNTPEVLLLLAAFSDNEPWFFGLNPNR